MTLEEPALNVHATGLAWYIESCFNACTGSKPANGRTSGYALGMKEISREARWMEKRSTKKEVQRYCGRGGLKRLIR
jgi:hypothetical protein